MIVFKLLLIVAVYVGVAILLAWFLARQCQTRRAKATAVILTLLVFALIPTWDILPGRLYFNHLCETEGGVKIHKTVEGVEGFYYFPGAEFREEALKQYGYEYIEAGIAGSFVRYTTVNDNLVRKEIDKLISEFGVARITETLPWHIKKYLEQVVRLDGGEVLAAKVQYEYEGGWIQRRVAPLLGGGSFCPHLPPSSLAVKEFYLATLKPNKY